MVNLTRTGYLNITATNVSVVSPTLVTCRFPITGAAAGSWNVVVTNPDGQSGIKTNGFTITYSSPTVTSLTPSSAPNSCPINITNLTGTSFQTGAKVNLTRIGSSNIVATNVIVTPPNKITCVLPITGAAAGVWNVMVKNPDGQTGTKAGGFSITPPPTPDNLGNYKGNGVFTFDYNGNGQWDGTTIDRIFFFGAPGDQGIIGDWDGDGKDEIGNYKTTGLWAVDYNGDGQWSGTSIDRTFMFGAPTDNPIVGDWTGDGKDEIGNYKGNGVWTFDMNGNGWWDGTTTDKICFFGGTGDLPIVGDWDGDGKDEIGNYKGNGLFTLDYNGNGQWDGTTIDRIVIFGAPGDQGVVGDWNGDGKDEVGNFKTTGIWAVDYNGNGQWDGTTIDRVYIFGAPTDKPIKGRWTVTSIFSVSLEQVVKPVPENGTKPPTVSEQVKIPAVSLPVYKSPEMSRPILPDSNQPSNPLVGNNLVADRKVKSPAF